jgi:DNA-directed RNA polymerase subunit RPC12/RpoP
MCTSTQRKLCGNCKICFERSFFSVDKLTKNKIKKIIDCWDYEENKIHPKYIRKRSHKIQSFICDSCNHIFKQSPDLIDRGYWCNYCSNKILCEERCKICFDKSLASFKEKTKKRKFKN